MEGELGKNSDALDTLKACLAALRTVDPTMPLARAELFVTLARDQEDEDGGLRRDAAEEIGLTRASAHRHAAALGPVNRFGETGYDLIEELPGSGLKLYALTPKGARLAKALAKIIVEGE